MDETQVVPKLTQLALTPFVRIAPKLIHASP